jgi:hypothetical protein
MSDMNLSENDNRRTDRPHLTLQEGVFLLDGHTVVFVYGPEICSWRYLAVRHFSVRNTAYITDTSRALYEARDVVRSFIFVKYQVQ